MFAECKEYVPVTVDDEGKIVEARMVASDSKGRFTISKTRRVASRLIVSLYTSNAAHRVVWFTI